MLGQRVRCQRTERAKRHAAHAAVAVAERLDSLFSRYEPSSQVSRLNAAAGRGPQRVDPQVAELLRRSVELSHLTRGSFDVSVGPLVSLWIDAARSGVPPEPAALVEARRFAARLFEAAGRSAPTVAPGVRPGVVRSVRNWHCMLRS